MWFFLVFCVLLWGFAVLVWSFVFSFGLSTTRKEVQTPSLDVFRCLLAVGLLAVWCPSARLCHDTDGGSGMAVVVVVVFLVGGGFFFSMVLFLFPSLPGEDNYNS